MATTTTDPSTARPGPRPAPGGRPSTGPTLRGIDPADVDAEVARRGLGTLGDDALLDLAADVVGVPHARRADSFGLHAPLELLARRGLLALAGPEDRAGIRRRLVWVAATDEAMSGPAEPVPSADHATVPDALAALGPALAAGDLDAVDATTAWLARWATVSDLEPLGGPLGPRLGAAGHAPILVELAARTAPRSRPAVGLLRAPAHELARDPDMVLRWVDEVPLAGDGDVGGLLDGLAGLPQLGVPGSTFVFPLMHQVDGGLAADALGPHLGPGTDVAAVGRALGRVAAWSMLVDDPAHAPYGWTHALTMAQAVVQLAPRSADPVRTVATAASHVAGYRAGLGSADLVAAVAAGTFGDPARVGNDAAPAPEALGIDPAVTAVAAVEGIGAVVDALDDAPATAAAAVVGLPEADVAAVVALLAGRGGSHPDAHVAKYVLASIDAGHRDPVWARLHLAAAASLVAWWSAAGVDDPMAG